MIDAKSDFLGNTVEWAGTRSGELLATDFVFTLTITVHYRALCSIVKRSQSDGVIGFSFGLVVIRHNPLPCNA